jgi:ketosteroid isomerase-like protein
MKTIYAVVLISVALLVFGCAQKVNDPADVQAIKKSMDDFVKAVNAGDGGAVAALATDKTVYADLNVPVAVGPEAIQSVWQAAFSQFNFEFSVPVEDVRVIGDVGVARGTWTAKHTPKAQGLAVGSEGGSWITTFARQNDGSWKWDWVVANSDQPLPGSTASGEDEQALYQIEHDWTEAVLKQDKAALDKILAADFVGHDASGVRNKKQAISSLTSASMKIESGALSEMKAIVLGNTAVVHGLWTDKTTTGGKDTSGRYRWTDTFVKLDGRWQCVGSYSAKIG